MKKYLGVPFISRLILGGIFIYSGLNKLANPESFERALHASGFLSNSLAGFIALVFPWAQIVLGALLFPGYFAKYVASTASLILLMFIIINILNAFKGSCQTCGFSSELVFIKRGNPFMLLTINYLLLGLSSTIVMSTTIFPMKHRFSSYGQVAFPLSLFFVIYLIMALFTFLARRSYEGKYISAASEERNHIINEVNNPGLTSGAFNPMQASLVLSLLFPGTLHSAVSSARPSPLC